MFLFLSRISPVCYRPPPSGLYSSYLFYLSFMVRMGDGAADGRESDLCGFLKLIIQSWGSSPAPQGAWRIGVVAHPPWRRFLSILFSLSLPPAPLALMHCYSFTFSLSLPWPFPLFSLLSRIFSPLCGVFCLGSLRLVASPLVPARFILQKVHYAVSVRRQSFLMS